eukprot:1207190-Prymnesium_polylepis.1
MGAWMPCSEDFAPASKPRCVRVIAYRLRPTLVHSNADRTEGTRREPAQTKAGGELEEAGKIARHAAFETLKQG